MKYTSVIVWTYDYSLLGCRSRDLVNWWQRFSNPRRNDNSQLKLDYFNYVKATHATLKLVFVKTIEI